MKQEAFEYINNTYGLSVRLGMRVIAYGKSGVVAKDCGNYVGIRLDGEKEIGKYHPTDGIEYLPDENQETAAEIETVETNEVDVVQTLIALPLKKTVLDVFVNKDNEVGFIVEQVKKYYEGVDKDISTKEKRKVFSAEAKKIKTAISRLKEMRLEETRRLQELPKIMISNNKILEDLLTDFHDEFRKPLTDLEAEEKRIADEKKAAKEAKQLAKQLELDHREALLMNAEFDAERARIKAEAEQQQKEHEARLKEEAEAKAKADAEYQSQLAIQQAKNAELEAVRAKETAEKEKAEALAKAEADKQAEITRINAEIEAREKAKADAEAKEKAEEEARKANIEHQRTINREAIACLMELDLEQATAEKILIAIVKGEIAHVSINY